MTHGKPADPSTGGSPVTEEDVRVALQACGALVALSAQSIATVEDEVDLLQFRALVVVAGQGPMSLSRLAASARISLTRASRLCDRMAGKGLLTRSNDPGDRRQLIVTLTGEGRRVVRKVSRRREAAIAAILQRMTERQRRDLVVGLGAFADAADALPADRDLWALGWSR